MQDIDDSNRKSMLDRGMAVLETLGYCRKQTNRLDLGRSVEKEVVDAMLNDLATCTRLREINEKFKPVWEGVASEDPSKP